MPLLKEKGFAPSEGALAKVVTLVRERAGFVTDLWKESDFFFVAPASYDPEVLKKRWNESSLSLIKELREVVAGTDPFTAQDSERIVKEWIAARGHNTGMVLNLFRLLIVGASRGPHLFDITEWIGREETLHRLDNGLSRLSQLV